MLDERDRRERIKELAGAVSTQANVANRAWVAMITVALFAVLPHLPTKEGTVALPFSLGVADPKWFHAVVFSILIILCIAFAAAHAQQVRAQKLAQSMVDKLSVGLVSVQIHPRELYDMLRLPSLNRVAPLAQLLRGKYQFYAKAESCPTWLRLATVCYYVLLKLASWIVYFIFPGCALWLAFRNVSPAGWVSHVLAGGGILAGVALFHVFLSEVMYVGKVVRELWGEPNPT